MRNREVRILIAAAVSALALVALAIEPPKPATPGGQTPAPQAEPPPAPVAEEPAAPPAEAPADGKAQAGEEEEETLPPLPPDTVPAGPPPARFNPTEKVRADFPVSFPIDI